MDIDKTIFSDLEKCDPEDVVKRTGCRFDKTGKKYFVKVWDHEYCVDLNALKVRPLGSGHKTYHEFLYLFILYYLMEAKGINPSGVWVSEKDIPGGSAFFRGPHTIPGNMITERFGNDLTSFKKRCIKLKGVRLDMADAAFKFHITPAIPAAVLYYFADEDFPCEAKLLFDYTIASHLPLDIIYALAVEICNIVGQGREAD